MSSDVLLTYSLSYSSRTRVTYAFPTKVPRKHIPIRRIAVLVPYYRILAFVEDEVGV